MNIYKSEEGKNLVRDACRELYSRWPVPSREVWIESREFDRTHILEMGPSDGPPLVLLHGSAGNSASWMGYAPGWAGHFRTLAVDIPGQPGLSGDTRPGLADGSTRRWLEEVIGGLGLTRPALCGMSLGGWIALDYAIAHPGETAALVLIAPSGIAPARTGFFLRILPLLVLGDYGSRRIIRLVHHPLRVDPAVEEFSLLVNRHYRPLVEPIPVFDDAALKSISPPLLYIGGAKDVMLDTPASAERIGRLVPEAETVVLPDTGHVVLDQSRRIFEFLRSVHRLP